MASFPGVTASVRSSLTLRQRRCSMRLLSLSAGTVIFLIPLAVFAQHSAAPTIVSPISSHAAAAPATAHSSSISPTRGSMTTSPTGTHGSRAPEVKHKLNAARTDDGTLSKSKADSRGQKPGFFSFLHKRPNKCDHGACKAVPSNSATLVRPATTVSPFAFERPVGCKTVPVFNISVPCNVYAPCCP